MCLSISVFSNNTLDCNIIVFYFKMQLFSYFGKTSSVHLGRGLNVAESADEQSFDLKEQYIVLMKPKCTRNEYLLDCVYERVDQQRLVLRSTSMAQKSPT